MSATIKDCLTAMARLTASGSGMGFKPKDAPWMLKMNEHSSPANWTPRQRYAVWDILSKYVVQLRSCGIDFFSVPIPPDPGSVAVVKPAVPVEPPPPKPSTIVQQVQPVSQRTCEMEGPHVFILKFPPNEWLDDLIKKTIPYQYRRKSKALDRWEITLAKSEGWVVVDFRNLLSTHRFVLSAQVLADINELLVAAREVEAKRDEAHRKSFLTEAKLEIPGFAVEKMYGFQRAGALYAIEKKRTFISDEPGCGKTVQAIAVVEHELAYPALIITKAGLRQNWLNELRRWVPGRHATTNPDDLKYDITKILVVSYEGSVKWYDKLEEYDWKSIVTDESHALKHAKSKRSRAARDLAKVSKAPIRLCLTGTPIENGPYELVPQLQFLGMMEAMGGSEFFYDRYCNRNSKGAQNLIELHNRLRRTCYIRREKKQVLTELPEKIRSIIPFEIDNMPEYKRAENEFINWLKGHVAKNPNAFAAVEGDDSIEAKTASAVGRASGAEELVKINYLKRLAMQGMLENAKAWIEDFIESGQKLIVFCHHIEAQQQIFQLFKDVAVWTHSSAGPQAAVQAFQSDERVKIIICSSGDTDGHTLTAASNVAFLELWWTSTKHDQATDRAHRIGQRDSVTAWYLIAKGTIYERIINLLESKRTIVDAATNGRESLSEKSIIRDLLQQMAA